MKVFYVRDNCYIISSVDSHSLETMLSSVIIMNLFYIWRGLSCKNDLNAAIFNILTDCNKKEKPYLCQLVTNKYTIMNINLKYYMKKFGKKEPAVPEKTLEIRKEFDISVPHKCFLCINSHNWDTSEDEKKDRIRYEDYKKDHPKDGNALWNNWLEKPKPQKYVYINGKEETSSLDNDKIHGLHLDLKFTLNCLHDKESRVRILHGYDYAFIKIAIDKVGFNGSKRLDSSMPAFRKLIQDSGFDDICGEKTLNKYYSNVKGQYPHFIFGDNRGKVLVEINRRIELINFFIDRMKESRGG